MDPISSTRLLNYIFLVVFNMVSVKFCYTREVFHVVICFLI